MTITNIDIKHQEGCSESYFEATNGFNLALSQIIKNDYWLRSAFLSYEVDYDTKRGWWTWFVRWAEVPSKSVEEKATLGGVVRN